MGVIHVDSYALTHETVMLFSLKFTETQTFISLFIYYVYDVCIYRWQLSHSYDSYYIS